MKMRFRRRMAGSAMVLASLGMVSTALVISDSSAGATTSNTSSSLTCSDSICVAIETVVFDIGNLINTLIPA